MAESKAEEVTFVAGVNCPACFRPFWGATRRRDTTLYGRCKCGAKGPVIEPAPDLTRELADG